MPDKFEVAQKLGKIVDKLDNYLAAADLSGLPPEFHLRQLKAGLSDMSKELKALFVDFTGDNPWDLPSLEDRAHDVAKRGCDNG